MVKFSKGAVKKSLGTADLVQIFLLYFSADKVVYAVSLLAQKCSNKLWQVQTVTFNLIISLQLEIN